MSLLDQSIHSLRLDYLSSAYSPKQPQFHVNAIYFLFQEQLLCTDVNYCILFFKTSVADMNRKYKIHDFIASKITQHIWIGNYYTLVYAWTDLVALFPYGLVFYTELNIIEWSQT